MPGLRVTVVIFSALVAAVCGWSAELTGSPETRSLQLSALGDRMFRAARFEEAESAYARSLEVNRGNVRGHLGLARIGMLLSDPVGAARHYSAAYQIAPLDPDAILGYAEAVDNSEARRVLFRNFLLLSRDSGMADPRTQQVRARLSIEERLGTRTLASLASPYQSYRVPLSALRSGGLLLRARIDDGRELKLILDSGADGITLNASAAADLPLEIVASGTLGGFGSSTPASVRVGLAYSFETAGFKIANLLVESGSTELTPDADGTVGLDVFRDFLIRLDPRGRTLELTPFAPREDSKVCPECVRAYRLGHLLLLRGTVNGTQGGYFILDSGAAHSVVSRRLVPGGGRAAVIGGIQGSQDVALPSAPVGLNFGGRHLLAFDCAALDTDEISARNGTEIAGAIGYSLLRDLALTVDYRAGLVRLAKPGRD